VEDGDELAGAALLSEIDGIVEYHLAGTTNTYVRASPSKLIIDFTRQWAKSRGNRILHLAGSLRRGDSLNHFKIGFSRREHAVSTWRVITDEGAYAELSRRWSELAVSAADPIGEYFPAYRRLLPGDGGSSPAGRDVT
jgi:hypothetical protein